jgi:hypothetical protein
MVELFPGLDRQFEVWVIFYLRPQLEWDTVGMEAMGPKRRHSAQRLCFSMHQCPQTIVQRGY